jgi:hypothetical protein
MADENQQTEQQQAAPARPDHIPEKYWDAANPLPAEVAAHPVIVNLAKGYGEAQAFIGKGKDALKAEIEAERLKGRPEKPDGYRIGLPAEGAPEGLVLLDTPPGADFKPEPGKTYFQVNQNDPLLAFWRQHCHDNALPEGAFQSGIAMFAQKMGERVPTPEQEQARLSEVYKALGENGERRAAHVWSHLKATLGEAAASEIDGLMGSPKAIAAVEALLEKAGAPKFSTATATAPVKKAEDLVAEAKALQREPGYQTSKEKQARVAELFRQAYPGETATAATGAGQPFVR